MQEDNENKEPIAKDVGDTAQQIDMPEEVAQLESSKPPNDETPLVAEETAPQTEELVAETPASEDESALPEDDSTPRNSDSASPEVASTPQSSDSTPPEDASTPRNSVSAPLEVASTLRPSDSAAPKVADTPRTSVSAPTTDVAGPSASVNQEIEMTLLSEAFDNYMRIANALMKTLKRPKDREICADLLQRVQSLNGSQQPEVKRNNNRFFRFLLRVLKYTSENQPLGYYRRLFNLSDDNERYDDKSTEIRSWLDENKMYMALKTLKDGTFMAYVAMANEPKDGWQDGGLAILDKKAACGRF